MIRRLCIVLLVLGLAGVGLAANGRLYSSGAAGISASQSNSVVTFTDNHSGGDASAFNATKIVIVNDGPDPIFVDYVDTTASTADWQVKIGESLILSPPALTSQGVPGIGIICASGKTATVRVNATRDYP